MKTTHLSGDDIDLHHSGALDGEAFPGRADPFVTATAGKHAPVFRFRFPDATKEVQTNAAMLKAFRTSKASLSSSGRFAVSSLPSKIRVHGDRSYATEAVFMSIPPAKAITTSRDPEGPLRPHLGVEVNPNHGLWAFFRKTAGKDGVESHETVEKKDSVVHYSGASLFFFLS